MNTGIPTTYKNRRYRSRLEARWACMFDLLGWAFEYEPYDLNGWIPDFVLMGRTNVLVEVKPLLVANLDAEMPGVREVREKIRGAEPTLEVIILGAAPFKPDPNILGWLVDEDDSGCNGGDEALVSIGQPYRDWDGRQGWDRSYRWDFCSLRGGWAGRLSGCHKCWQGADALPAMWAEAGNAVQWKAPKTKEEQIAELKRKLQRV